MKSLAFSFHEKCSLRMECHIQFSCRGLGTRSKFNQSNWDIQNPKLIQNSFDYKRGNKPTYDKHKRIQVHLSNKDCANGNNFQSPIDPKLNSVVNIQLAWFKFVSFFHPWPVYELRVFNLFNFIEKKLNRETCNTKQNRSNTFSEFKSRKCPKRKDQSQRNTVSKKTQRRDHFKSYFRDHKNTSFTSFSIAYFMNFSKFTPFLKIIKDLFLEVYGNRKRIYLLQNALKTFYKTQTFFVILRCKCTESTHTASILKLIIWVFMGVFMSESHLTYGCLWVYFWV